MSEVDSLHLVTATMKQVISRRAILAQNQMTATRVERQTRAVRIESQKKIATMPQRTSSG
jgi:hypothetical protein